MNRSDTAAAIDMLSRVVEIDPEFADAWGRLAHACSQMGSHLDPDPQWFLKAEQAIASALELDPVQCDALCARGQVLWSPARGFSHLPALRAMNAALKIHPGRYNFRHLRGVILFHLGFHEQARHDMEESLLSNPGYALALTTLGVIACYNGEFEASNEILERSYRLDPALMHTNILAPETSLALGKLDEARDRIRRARKIFPDESKLTSLEALMAAYEGDWVRAEHLADDACSAGRKTMTHTHHTWHSAAGAYAMCGKPAKAMEQLRQCAQMGLPNYRLFTNDPHMASLRANSEFISLMSEMRREHDQYTAVVESTAETAPARM
jgi:Tfp pilus assembly protein PilF